MHVKVAQMESKLSQGDIWVSMEETTSFLDIEARFLVQN